MNMPDHVHIDGMTFLTTGLMIVAWLVIFRILGSFFGTNAFGKFFLSI
jgi:hypothetical protein